MPKIQAYKHRGTVIPVNEAKTCKAYQCPWTGRVMASKSTYVKHLKKLREERMRANARKRKHKLLLEDLNSQSSFEDIIKWIELHSEWFLDAACHGNPNRYHESIRKDFSVKIVHLRLDWLNRVSNSHSCPRGGVTNWGGCDLLPDGTPKPRGYPGWDGRITYRVSHDVSWVNRAFNEAGIYTGTGGGGRDGLRSYDVKFFMNDWPGLRKKATVDLLANRTPVSIRYGHERA